MFAARKLIAPLLIASALLAAAPAPSLAQGPPPRHYRISVPFNVTMTPEQCPDLTLAITLSGEITGVGNIVNKADGGTQVRENTHAMGTATDSAGGTYRFTYANGATYSFPPGGTPIEVKMQDMFNLVGNGAFNKVHAGFSYRWKTDGELWPPQYDLQIINIRGAGVACDPI